MSWIDYQPPEVIERCRGLAGEIQLQRRGLEYEIIYNGVFLMATYNGASEKAAVKEALAITTRTYKGPVKVLMGGLGVGYSLREALNWPLVTRVTAAEIEPAVVRWNREVLSEVNGDALADPRVQLYSGDFKDLLQKEAQAVSKHLSLGYQVVVVDTDNGSTWLSLPGNQYFYKPEGVKLIDQCLMPGGIACFWCSKEEKAFAELLKTGFERVIFRSVPERTGKTGSFYLACKAED
ncbi:MAG: spermine/spermidine synthase [Bacillota bacterium]